MPDIDLGPEHETATGWHYDTTVFDQGRVFRLTLALSFADYDRWSRGAWPPSRVAEQALAAALPHLPADQLPTKVDCATLSRRVPAVDQAFAKPNP